MQIPIVHFNDVLDGEPPSALAPEQKGEPDLAPVRAAQQQWASTSLRERLRVIRNFRHALASRSTELVRALRPASETEAAEILSAQIIPLAEACKFLEREAEKILAPNRRPRGSVPLWLRDTRAEVHREPCGGVLVVAPSNYPVFLPGVVLVQALAAGNAVLLKPAPGGGAAMDALLDLLRVAELPAALVTKLDESAEAVVGKGDLKRLLCLGRAHQFAVDGFGVKGRLVNRGIRRGPDDAQDDALIFRWCEFLGRQQEQGN